MPVFVQQFHAFEGIHGFHKPNIFFVLDVCFKDQILAKGEGLNARYAGFHLGPLKNQYDERSFNDDL